MRRERKAVNILNDTRIIELFFERSEEAIRALSDKYGILCKSVAKNILSSGCDAEECENDVYLAVWNSIPPERPTHLNAYVCRVARNIAIAKYHANSAEKRNSHYDVALDELEAVFASDETVENEFDARLTAKSIDAFLLTIDADLRVMFVRRYYLAESVSEIAERFGLTPHAVSVKLFRVRERLKKHLEREGITV